MFNISNFTFVSIIVKYLLSLSRKGKIQRYSQIMYIYIYIYIYIYNVILKSSKSKKVKRGKCNIIK